MITSSILLIDDEPVIVASLARDLECKEYAVGKAGSGKEALQLLSEVAYDLVITDLVMPEMNGLEVLRSVKAASPDTGVFILTGYGDMNSAIDALRLGADDYLIKPCNPDELLLRIDRYMEKRAALRTINLYENILPICSFCKKIRDDANVLPGTGQWVPVEEYIAKKSGVMVSHGCCPACYEKYQQEEGL